MVWDFEECGCSFGPLLRVDDGVPALRDSRGIFQVCTEKGCPGSELEEQRNAELIGSLPDGPTPLLDGGHCIASFLFGQMHHAVGRTEREHLGGDEPGRRGEREQSSIGDSHDRSHSLTTFASLLPGPQDLEDLLICPGSRGERGFGGELREANDIAQFMSSGVYKAGIAGFAQEFVQAIDMVVVPMRGDNHLHAVADVDIHCAEIIESNRLAGGPVAKGVDDDPIAVSDMDHQAFPEARAEDGNLDFMRRGGVAIHVPEAR